MDFIGKGEKTALKILKELFPYSQFLTQLPLRKLLKDEYNRTKSDRQAKETLDIVIERGSKLKHLVIRVQDKHHKTQYMSNIDRVQKQLLEKNGCDVVDLWYNECPILFQDELNDESRDEVKWFMSTYL